MKSISFCLGVVGWVSDGACIKEDTGMFHLKSKTYGFLYLASIPAFGMAYYLMPGTLNCNEFLESWYFSAVTVTTLGYGDVLPVTSIGKVLAGIHAVSGVCIIGLFLNSLSERRAERIKELESLENRKILEKHICLILEAVKSGNPFIWDKHAKHAAPIIELEDYARTLKDDIWSKEKTKQLGPLQIKSLIETCNQIYNTMLGLIPVASNISGEVGGEWISIVSNVKRLSDQYSKAIENHNEGDVINWPTQDCIATQVEEFVQSALFVCDVKSMPNKHRDGKGGDTLFCIKRRSQ
ncbi:MAG: potassium channel family protein [Gammaproteobacteria bacterium]|nr:potassium channel family protein [Gammaproteobacteria bacterium]